MKIPILHLAEWGSVSALYSPYNIYGNQQERRQYGGHLHLMFHWGYPYFLEEIHAPHYRYPRPKHHDSGDSHAYVRSPSTDMQLLGEDKERTDKAYQAYNHCRRMVVSE